MITLLPVALGALGLVAAAPDVFTPVDMLTAPRPHPAVAAPGGLLAISFVDQWDQKTDLSVTHMYW